MGYTLAGSRRDTFLMTISAGNVAEAGCDTKKAVGRKTNPGFDIGLDTAVTVYSEPKPRYFESKFRYLEP